MDIARRGREFAESWINGNHTYVLQEIGEMPPGTAAGVAVYVFETFDDQDDRGRFQRGLERIAEGEEEDFEEDDDDEDYDD